MRCHPGPHHRRDGGDFLAVNDLPTAVRNAFYAYESSPSYGVGADGARRVSY